MILGTRTEQKNTVGHTGWSGESFFWFFFYDVCVFKKSSRVVLVLGTVIYRGRGKNKEGKNTEGSKIRTTENKEARHLTEIQKTQVNAGRL